MINSKWLVGLASKWQKKAAMKRQRISFTENDDDRQNSSFVSNKGHFVVYTADKMQFTVPLEYLTGYFNILKVSDYIYFGYSWRKFCMGRSHCYMPPKVDLVLYYETLSPACADFITTDLVKVFRTDLNTIVNLRLVPWGNAKVINSTIVCQHGEDECYLKIIDAYIIKAWPEVKKHFPFISCIEADNSAIITRIIYNVCHAYKGGPVKAGKSKLSPSTLKDTSTNTVCYTDESRNSSLFFSADDSETTPTR
ncbi:hypothetical protein Ddye_009022 [Dipteronia dyeriana]|uniref:Uncharacterized protein n=1 Tax=Dipteronia dyeriana TaxID=168575 RepID=A0AAD9XAW0_9ROSI|nr:hypothetical protein Ddye_009022 [Dipteronia dyeriana]